MEIAAFGMAVLACTLPFLGEVAADPDLWWHLRTGQRILETGAIPTVDDWSFTASGRPWINHEWLTDAVFAMAYRWAGATGLVLLRGALFVSLIAGLAVLGARRVREPLIVCAVLIITVPVLDIFINVRAHSFTYALTVWAIVAVDAARAGRLAWLIILPPMMALWVNLHGGFLLGLGLIGASLGAMLLGLDGIQSRPTGRAATAIVIAGLATLAAAILNPWGLSLFGNLVSHLEADTSLISEWQPVQGAQLLFFVVYLTAPLLLWIAAKRFSHVSLVFMLLIAAWSTWLHVRFFVLVALFSAVVALGALGVLAKRRRKRQRPGLLDKLLHPGVTLAGMSVVAALGAGQLTVGLVRGGPALTVDAELFPVEAVRWLSEQPMQGRIVQPLHWGGYILWHLPEYRVALDGRNLTVYDAEWVGSYLRGLRDGTLTEVIPPSTVDIWLLPDGPQVEALEAMGWVRAYEDSVAVVLTQSATETAWGPAPPIDARFP